MSTPKTIASIEQVLEETVRSCNAKIFKLTNKNKHKN